MGAQAWVDMGRVVPDDKGRVVIPAGVRQASFQGQDHPTLAVYVAPNGYILLQPVPKRRPE